MQQVRCGDYARVLEGKFSPPNSCETDGCKSRTFRPDRDSAITVDYQSIVLQESIDEQNGRSQTRRQKGGDPADENRNVPRTMTIEFMHELVDTIVPGDLVTISGSLRRLISTRSRGEVQCRAAAAGKRAS